MSNKNEAIYSSAFNADFELRNAQYWLHNLETSIRNCKQLNFEDRTNMVGYLEYINNCMLRHISNCLSDILEETKPFDDSKNIKQKRVRPYP